MFKKQKINKAGMLLRFDPKEPHAILMADLPTSYYLSRIQELCIEAKKDPELETVKFREIGELAIMGIIKTRLE